ncbi:MAG: type II toxin-antitoxin system Phd/YefM family antitoxin [Allorhizobium sp.]
MTVMTSREFNQDTGKAKKAARDGPVIITDRGKSAYVLMTMEDFVKRSGGAQTVGDAFAMPGGSDIAFEPEKLDDVGFRPAEFD